jgi:F-type H+-transporting ATPase subunit a
VKRTLFGIAALAIASWPLAAVAEEAPAGGHEAPAEGHAAEGHRAAGGGHAAKGGGGGHWSLLDEVVPGAVRAELAGGLGDTWIDHQPVTSIDHVIFAVVVIALVLALLALARRKMSKDEVLPEGRLSPLGLFDALSDLLLGVVMEPILGRERALKFLPLVGSLGIFILFSNFLGTIPGLLPPTSNLNTTFALGTVVFCATHYFGVRSHGISYFKHFFGPIIKWYALPLMLLMFLIELISHIARPVSLGIRLFGNIFGDHATVAGFLAVGVFGWAILPLIPFPLGLLVCVVQTLVFCILSTVYIHVATEEAEEGHEGAH